MLAVCAVRQYLSSTCELDLDLSQSNSWQVGLQSIMNVADLVIPNVGKDDLLDLIYSTRINHLQEFAGILGTG
jgi:hypothetical protein